MKAKDLKAVLNNVPDHFDICVVYPHAKVPYATMLDDVGGWNFNGDCIQLEAQAWLDGTGRVKETSPYEQIEDRFTKPTPKS